MAGENKAVGNSAKLREFAELVSHMNDDGYWNGSASICALVDKAKAALAAPPRNCDVYNPEGLVRMHNSYCGNGRGSFACINSSASECKKCFAKWVQMLNESEAKNESKE